MQLEDILQYHYASAVQCSAVQCLLSTQCSAVLEVAARASQAAATRLS